MDNNGKINITDMDGNNILCDVLFTFDSNDTNKSYIVYTDNTKDEFGNIKVYANAYDPNNDKGILDSIETEEEWATIEQIFDSIKDYKE